MRDYPSQGSGVIHVNGVRDPHNRTYRQLDSWLRAHGTSLMREAFKLLHGVDSTDVNKLKFERHCQVVRAYLDQHGCPPGDEAHPSYWWLAKVRTGKIKDRWNLLVQYKLTRWAANADYRYEVAFEKVCQRLVKFVEKHGRLPKQKEPDGWRLTNLRARPRAFARRKQLLQKHGLLRLFEQ